MKLDIAISFTRGDAPALAPADTSWKADAMILLREANASAHEAGLEPVERERRLRWLGGAIRMYALAAGEDPEVVRASLPGRGPVAVSAPPAAAPAPGGSVPSLSAIGTVTPPDKRRDRPPRPPGAQRVAAVQPSDLPDGMFDGLPEFEAPAEDGGEDAPTQVTVHPPEVRTSADEAG